MQKQQLLLISACAAAAFFIQSASPAFAEDQEFQCSAGYRIFLPDPGPNGVIQTSSMFDRMIFERDGLWLHDDTNIQFELIGESPLLVVDGEEIVCEQVPEAIVTAAVEPASPRASRLASEVARTTPAPTTSEKTDRVEPQIADAVIVPPDPQPSEPEQEIASVNVEDTPLEPQTPAIDEVTTTGSLTVVPEKEDEVGIEPTPALTGESRGGRLRSGPGTDYAIAGALEEGAPVVILENVGNTYRGYDWFEIEYGDGQKAFTWGGILCTDGEQTAGVFEVCS